MHHDKTIDRFYSRRVWRECRASFLASKGGLCEACLAKGIYKHATQVHHKVIITPDNVKDPAVTLNHANLMALCDDCHREQHQKTRWRCDPFGHVIL